MAKRKKVNTVKVDSENLRRLCWANGFRGIPDLASEIGRSRVTVWRAVKSPKQYAPTYKLITEALSV
jgi:hypothetical protein